MSALFSAASDGIAELARAKPLGPVVLAAYFVSCISSILLLVAAFGARKSHDSAPYRILAWIASLSFLAGAALSAKIVQSAHALILNPSSHEPAQPYAKFFSAYLQGIVQADSTWIVSTLALVFVSLFALGASLLRGGRFRPFSSLVSALGLGTGVALLWARHVGTLHSFCGDPDGRCEALQSLHVDAMAVSSVARIGLVALALLGSIAVVWFERKNKSEMDRVQEDLVLARGAFVLALGLVLFFRTRAMAHDARHPLPLREPHEQVCPSFPQSRDEQAARALPSASACESRCEGSELVVDGEHITLDGIDVADLGALEKLLADKRSLYRQIVSPDRPLPPLILAARSDTKASEIEAMVRIALRAFGPTITAASVMPEKTLKTASVGELRLLPRCCCRRLSLITGDDARLKGEKQLGSYATWAEVVDALAKGSAFSIGP